MARTDTAPPTTAATISIFTNRLQTYAQAIQLTRLHGYVGVSIQCRQARSKRGGDFQ
jgi:hypothetical protein